MSRLSRDAILYDQAQDSSIGYIRRVAEESAIPNTLKTRKEFDGFFVKKVEYLDGKFLFDPHLASYVSSNYENFSDIKNDIFICLVFVPELHHINRDTLPKEPSGEEFDKLVEKLLASRKGVFKKYDYQGEEPAYMAPVKVSFADTDGFTDPLFETPLAGGAAVVGGAAGAGGVVGECGAVGSVNTTVGNANNGNNNVGQTQTPPPPNATAEIIITKTGADEFMAQDSTLTVTSTDGEEFTISFNSAMPINNDDLRPSEGTGDEVMYGLSGIRGTDGSSTSALENILARTLNNAFNVVFEKGFTSEISALLAESAPAVGAPTTTTNVLRTSDCDFEKFNSDYINHGNGAYVIFVPKEFNSQLPINVMLWFHGNGGIGGKEAKRAAKVIDEGPGLPKGENRIFIAPSLGSSPSSISGANVSNPVVKPEFLEEAVTSLYSRLFPGDPSTGAPGPIPVIQTIRGYGWSAGGSPLSQFFANYIEKYGLEKIKTIRYLDADYGNKDHINFAKKFKELLEAGTQGANFAQTWNSIVSHVVQIKGKPGTPLAKPLQYSWAYADKGYPKKGNQERHDMFYPQGVPIYVLDIGHTQCGWQTADYIDTATEGSTVPSQVSIDARIKLTQKIAGSSGNTPILFAGTGLTVSNFTGGRDVQEAATPEEPAKPAANPVGTAGSVPAPTPKKEPVKVPEEEIDFILKTAVEYPYPTGDFDTGTYLRTSPIFVLKSARAFGLEVPDKLINILKIRRYYDEAQKLLEKSQIAAQYFAEADNINAGLVDQINRPPLFANIFNQAASKEAEATAVTSVSKDLLLPFLEDLALLVYPGEAERRAAADPTAPPAADPTAPGGPAAPPVPAPAGEKPTTEEVNQTTPGVSQPTQPQPASNTCAQAGMVGVGMEGAGGGVSSGAVAGSVTPGGAAKPGEFSYGSGEPLANALPLDPNGTKNKKVWGEICANGNYGNIKGGGGFGQLFPIGDGTPDFPAYTEPSTKGKRSSTFGITKKTPINKVMKITAEYMRPDAAWHANKVGQEVRSKGGVFMRDSTQRAFGSKNRCPGNHALGLAIDLTPGGAMCDPTQDLYVVTVDRVHNNRLYWRVYARSVGYQNIDSITNWKNGKASVAKHKDDWYFADSMPPAQVPNITLNAAFVRHNPGYNGAKLFFTQVTGPFIDLTEIFIRHGFLPIGAHDSSSNSPFWAFRKKEFPDYGITEQNVPQGLPLKGYAGAEWWHFEFLKNNVKGDTLQAQLLRRGGGLEGTRKVVRDSFYSKYGFFKKVQAENPGLSDSEVKKLAKKDSRLIAKVDNWFSTVWPTHASKKATPSTYGKAIGITVYGNWYR